MFLVGTKFTVRLVDKEYTRRIKILVQNQR